MKIYTKTGDGGQTGLYGGQRVSKADLRVWAYGEVDEACSYLGVVRSSLPLSLRSPQSPDSAGELSTHLDDMLRLIQDDLMVTGSDLATPSTDAADSDRIRRLQTEHVTRLEGWIDAHDAKLEPMTHFILPGGAPVAAQLIFARTIVRRAERATVALAASERIGEHVIRYLNRLSDLLFVLGRAVNHELGVREEPWNV